MKKFTDSCWIPTQTPKPDGYVQLRYYKEKGKYLHRLMYETFLGDIEDGLYLDHLCRERSCCNPNHLEPVTNAENIRRGLSGNYQKVKTHCPRGHAYDKANTYHYKEQRHCKKCRNIAQKKYEGRLQYV